MLIRAKSHAVIARAVILCALVGADLRAQAPDSLLAARMDTEASTVAASLRAKGHAGPVLYVLTQAYAQQPREKMDEIADTLLSIAVGLPGDDFEAHRTRTSAARALMAAASIDTTPVSGPGRRRRIPYAGGVDRLIKLVESSPDVGAQASALNELRDIMDRSDYLAFVRQVAMSQSPAVLPAIRILYEQTGPEGLAILRELYEKGRITLPHIDEVLERVAPPDWSGTRITQRLAFPRKSDPSAADVAELLRTHADAGLVAWVLTQAYAPVPRARLDSIADTLAHIAITFPDENPRAAITRREAEQALSLAGSGRIGVDSGGKVIPYAGAASRLMRIVENAQDPGIRARAVTSMMLLPDTTQRLPILRKIATSRNGVAITALEILNLKSGPEGLEVLRELHRKGLVAEPRARDYLDRAASARGWMAPGIRAPIQ